MSWKRDTNLRSITVGAVALGMLAGAASAGSYENYAHGLSAYVLWQMPQAIAELSAALAAGDLAAIYVPVAHLRRAEAYLETGKCREALDDTEPALAARPDDTEVLMTRAAALNCLGRHVEADAAFATLQAGGRLGVMGLYSYGIQLWRYGRLADAAVKFRQSLQQTKDGSSKTMRFVALWTAITAHRSGTFDPQTFAMDTKKVSVGAWPGVLVNVMRQKATEADVQAEIADADETEKNGKQCEANFYLGELAWGQGTLDTARTRLEAAVEHCPKSYFEYSMGQTELERLTAAKTKPQTPQKP